MNVVTQNLPNAPVFEVPDPVDEFGQDGGKFYRCYDALADEIDEDMVKGLKEQLDGMLIFAPADPADDISALLAQKNAILIQMAMGRNDSIPTSSRLPSTEFSPFRDIIAVNALFSLSLAFAVISSFLAVLGRQRLVYYRKRAEAANNELGTLPPNSDTTPDTVREALENLVGQESPDIPNAGRLVTNILQWANHMIFAENSREEFTIERRFTFLECFERILRNPRLPEEARSRIREMLGHVSQSWQNKCAVAAIGWIPKSLPDPLEHCIVNARAIHQAEKDYPESIDILRIFGLPTREFISYDYINVASESERSRFELIETSNNFVLEVDQTSRQIQNTARRVRDRDERWRHHEEERVSFRAVYSLC